MSVIGQLAECQYNHGIMSVFLQVSKGSANVLSKYSVLQQKEAQNLEVVAFCEDISKWVMIFLFKAYFVDLPVWAG